MRKLIRELVEYFFCDTCDKPIPPHNRSYICKRCQRDVCVNCVKEQPCMPARVELDFFCPECWGIGESHRKHIAEMTAIFIKGVQDAEARWQKECDQASQLEQAAEKMKGVADPSDDAFQKEQAEAEQEES